MYGLSKICTHYLTFQKIGVFLIIGYLLLRTYLFPFYGILFSGVPYQCRNALGRGLDNASANLRISPFFFFICLINCPIFFPPYPKAPFTLHRIYCSTLSCFSVERHKSRNHDNCHNDNKHHDHRHQKFCGCSLSKNTCFSLSFFPCFG